MSPISDAYSKFVNITMTILNEAFIKKESVKSENTTANATQKIIASYSLVLIAIVVNIIGVYICTIYKKINKNVVMSRDDLLKLPITLSCTLFGLFVFMKLISPEHITFIIQMYTLAYGLVALGSLLSHVTELLWCESLYHNRAFNINISEDTKELALFVVKFSDIASYIISLIIVVFYYKSNMWILNNIIAASFTILLIETLTLDKFWHALLLFIGLFIYDVFWVFGSNVMVTVALKINAPIMFKFPYTIYKPESTIVFAGLGLGDVAIPGLYLAFMLRYDLNKTKRDYHHFISSLVSYILGLIICTIVADYTGKGQPAFFYIVPLFILTSIGCGIIKQDLFDMIKFNIDDIKTPQPEIKEKTN